MKKHLIILLAIGFFSVTNYGFKCKSLQDDKKYDAKAADFSHVFKNEIFTLNHWDNENNIGFGIFDKDDMLYLKSWSGDSYGMESKFIINNPEHGITNSSGNYWKDYIVKLCKLVLIERDVNMVKEAELDLFEDTSEIYITPESNYYNSFEIIVKEVNMETIVVIIYYNRK